MVRIRVLVPLATMGRCYEKGDIANWEKADAQKLFAAGFAEPYTDKSEK